MSLPVLTIRTFFRGSTSPLSYRCMYNASPAAADGPVGMYLLSISAAALMYSSFVL